MNGKDLQMIYLNSIRNKDAREIGAGIATVSVTDNRKQKSLKRLPVNTASAIKTTPTRCLSRLAAPIPMQPIGSRTFLM